MKYRVFVSAVVASLLFASSLAVAEPLRRAYTTEVNGIELKMRPSLYAPAIAVLRPNTFVMFWGGESDVQEVNGVQGRWVYVQSSHGRGWLFSAYLQADPAVKSKTTNVAKREMTDSQSDDQKKLASLKRMR